MLSEGKWLDIKTVANKILVLAQSELCVLADSCAVVRGVAQLVRGLVSDEGPSAEDVASFSLLYKLVVKRMEHFYRYEVTVPNTGAGAKIFSTEKKMLTGKAAIEATIEDTKVALDGGAIKIIGELQWSRTYAWLLTPQQLQITSGWLLKAPVKAGIKHMLGDAKGTGAVMSSDGDTSAAAASSSSSSASCCAAAAPAPPPAKKPKTVAEQKKASKAESHHSDMMAFFTGMV